MTILLTKTEVCRRVGFSKAHVGRLANDKLYAKFGFPRPTRIGFKVLWSDEELEAWIKAQLARRDATP